MSVDGIIAEYSSALLQYPDTESFSNCRVVISKEEKSKEAKYGGAAAAETIDLCDWIETLLCSMCYLKVLSGIFNILIAEELWMR